MPSFVHHPHQADVSRPWPEIVAAFVAWADANPELSAAAQLVGRIAGSPYVESGLHGLTSMHDLLIGPTSRVLANPYLRIRWSHDRGAFDFTYEDGSLAPWTRQAKLDEAYDVFERFLVKRARWFSRGADAAG